MKGSEMEPTALATDVGKEIPILEGEDAERFLKLAKEAEDNVFLNEMERELEELEIQIELRRING